ncbi:MAG: hydrogenase maturation protease [Candidatus Bipolaricaulia bacterium]
MRVLILGLGNELLRDDGLGIYAAQALRAELELKPEKRGIELEVLESPLSGPAILDLLIGYDRAIIIDAVRTEGGRPGEIYELDLDELQLGLKPSPSLHYAGLPELWALAEGLGLDFPKVKIYAVEAGDLSFGEGLTEAVTKALPELLSLVREEIRRLPSVNRAPA